MTRKLDPMTLPISHATSYSLLLIIAHTYIILFYIIKLTHTAASYSNINININVNVNLILMLMLMLC